MTTGATFEGAFKLDGGMDMQGGDLLLGGGKIAEDFEVTGTAIFSGGVELGSRRVGMENTTLDGDFVMRGDVGVDGVLRVDNQTLSLKNAVVMGE